MKRFALLETSKNSNGMHTCNLLQKYVQVRVFGFLSEIKYKSQSNKTCKSNINIFNEGAYIPQVFVPRVETGCELGRLEALVDANNQRVVLRSSRRLTIKVHLQIQRIGTCMLHIQDMMMS